MRLSNLGIAQMALAPPTQGNSGSLAVPDFSATYRAGAYVYGCVWYAQRIDDPFTVHFVAGGSGDKCMKSAGSNVDMKVKAAGLTCGSIGWVKCDEEWSGVFGGCYIKESIWTLSYTTSEGAVYSGSTQVKWETGPWNTEVSLRKASAGTNICWSEAKCASSGFEWAHNTNSYVYVVFDPMFAGAGVEEEDLQLDL